MAKQVMLVFTEPVPGEEEAFERFQIEEHLPDVLRCDGFVAAQRYRLADAQPGFAGGAPSQRYVTVYEIECEDAEAAARSVEAGRTGGGWRPTTGVAPGRIAAIYTAVSPRLEPGPG